MVEYKYHKSEVEKGKKIIIMYNPNNPYESITHEERGNRMWWGKAYLLIGLFLAAKPLTTALLALVLNNNKFFEFIWGIKLTKASMKM